MHEVGPLDLLLANEDEARALAPGGNLRELTGQTALAVVKRGGEGAMALQAAATLSAAAEPITVADTTGAGDAFDAAFLVEFLTHRDVGAALAAANRLGGRVASQLGAQ
jgi:sugar/nucleoside kinase (ribokinase family)